MEGYCTREQSPTLKKKLNWLLCPPYYISLCFLSFRCTQLQLQLQLLLRSSTPLRRRRRRRPFLVVVLVNWRRRKTETHYRCQFQRLRHRPPRHPLPERHPLHRSFHRRRMHLRKHRRMHPRMPKHAARLRERSANWPRIVNGPVPSVRTRSVRRTPRSPRSNSAVRLNATPTCLLDHGRIKTVAMRS